MSYSSLPLWLRLVEVCWLLQAVKKLRHNIRPSPKLRPLPRRREVVDMFMGEDYEVSGSQFMKKNGTAQ